MKKKIAHFYKSIVHFSKICCDVVGNSLVDEGWYQLTAVLNFQLGVLKRIQTPHSFLGFQSRENLTKLITHWSGGRVQVEVQVQAPVSQLAITPKGCSRRKLKVD